MLDIKDRLGERYRVFSNKDKETLIMKVFSIVNEMVDQEIGVELVCNESICELFEIQRGTKYSIGIFDDKNNGEIALYFAVIAIMGPSFAEHEVRETLREFDCEDVNSVKKILNKYIGEQYYSLFDKVKGAINLEKSEDGDYFIYYLSRFGKTVSIVKDIDIKTGFVVMYNYGLKLKYFNDLIKDLAKDNVYLNADEEEKIKRVFLRK